MYQDEFSSALTLLERLVQTPSFSREEEAAADLLGRYLTDCGIPFQRCGNNIWALHPDYHPKKETLLLCAHLDTVRPAAGWESDPFTPIRREGKVIGLGTNDDGASLVSLLQAFRILFHKPLPYNLVFLAEAEEEVSGKGGLECVLPLLPQPSAALVGEPTGMRPAIAEKGLMVLDLTARGKAGHAARDEGDNALYKMLPDIMWLQSYHFPKVSPLLGAVKMTVTALHSGKEHNVVPALCEAIVDVRSNECYTNAEILAVMQEHLLCEVKARSLRLGSSHIDRTHPLAACAIRLCGEPFGSPTLSDQALLPCPSLKMGPGESARSHTANEFILEEEIAQAIPLYVKLLSEWSGA